MEALAWRVEAEPLVEACQRLEQSHTVAIEARRAVERSLQERLRSQGILVEALRLEVALTDAQTDQWRRKYQRQRRTTRLLILGGTALLGVGVWRVAF